MKQGNTGAVWAPVDKSPQQTQEPLLSFRAVLFFYEKLTRAAKRQLPSAKGLFLLRRGTSGNILRKRKIGHAKGYPKNGNLDPFRRFLENPRAFGSIVAFPKTEARSSERSVHLASAAGFHSKFYSTHTLGFPESPANGRPLIHRAARRLSLLG